MDLNSIDPNNELLLQSIESTPNLPSDVTSLIRSIRADHAYTAVQQKTNTAQAGPAPSMPTYNVAGVPVADWTVPLANWLKQNVSNPIRNAASQTEQDIPGIAGKAIAGTARLGANFVPETPGQVKLNMVAPLAGELVGGATKAALGTELGQSGIKVASGVIQGLSKLSAPLVEKVLNTPEILDRYIPVEKAGQLMSDFFSQLGLKSGSQAMEQEAERLGEAAPNLGNFKGLANKTVTAIKQEPQTLSQMQELQQELQRRASGGVNEEGPMGTKGTVELAQEYKDLQDKLPNVQDALATRQYLSKITAKQANQAVENQVVAPIANKNLSLVDSWADNEIDRLMDQASKEGKSLNFNVPGYGKVTTPEQLRQIYHEAKIGEAFSSSVPVNRNEQVDALRTTLGLLSGSPKAAFESPLLYKTAVQSARAATTGSNILKGTEAITGLENQLKPQE